MKYVDKSEIFIFLRLILKLREHLNNQHVKLPQNLNFHRDGQT